MARVFLSHSSRDGAPVETVAAALRADGHEVFLDRHPADGVAVGAQWERVLYDRLHAADAVVCVVTEHHVESRWCFTEVALAKSLGRLVLAIGDVRHPLLADVQAAADLDRVRERLITLDAQGGRAPDPTRPLYPGLRAYDVADAPVYFGRHTEADELASLVRALRVQRATTAALVVGGSGSGKSSLVRAGLVPLLAGEGWWPVPPVLPGTEPLAATALALGRLWRRWQPGRSCTVAELVARLSADASTLAADLLLAAPAATRGLLLVIDQFEEVFTRAARQTAEPFLAALDRLAQPDVPVTVVATMRAEYTRELLAEPSTGALREHLFPLAPLARAGLATVVRGPARLGRLRLDDALVERLVEDTASGEALPLLAHVLQQLTNGRRPGDHIGVADYERLGGVHGALRRQADNTLARAEQVTGRPATEILAALTELVSVDGEGRRTRRRIPRVAVPELLRRAVDVFVDARLLTTGESLLTVSHEALFTAWPRLSEAIASRAEQLRLRRSLEQAAADWTAAEHEPSMLWRGTRLARARSELDDVTSIERAFLDAAAEADLQLRRRDADRLAEQVRVSELAERDAELALLLLLAAADEYAPTPAVIGGLRHALARHRERDVAPPTTRYPVGTSRSGATLHTAAASDAPTPLTRIDLPLLRKATTLRWLADGRRLAFTADAVVDIDSGVWRSLPEVLAVSADAATVLTGHGLYDMAADTIRALPESIRVATFNEDGRFLAVGGYDELLLVDVATGVVDARFKDEEEDEEEVDPYWRWRRTYQDVWANRDGTRLVSMSSEDDAAHLWDVAAGRVLRDLPTDVLDRSPDSLAIVGPELRDVMATLPAGVEIRGSSGLVLIVAPDHATLLVQGLHKADYGTWSEFTLPEGRPMMVHPQRWTAATFSPDGSVLLCVDDEGQVALSPSRSPSDVITRARLVVHRELRDAERAAVGLATRPVGARGKIEA